MHDTVVHRGRVVTRHGVVVADLGLTGGIVAEISAHPLRGRRDIDAAGLVVLPGAVDLHVHFNEPGRTHWEGWARGSRAAAAGGVTTVVEMPLNSIPATVSADTLRAKVAAASGQSMVDFALWGGLTPGNLAQLPALAEAGAIGFKAFMSDSATPEFPCVDDGVLLAGLERARDLGLPLAVHAENDAITRDAATRMRAQGRRDPGAWTESRPPLAELEAIQRALLLARRARCGLHVVHMTLPEGSASISAARAAGQAVTVETCPHYLTLVDDDLVRLGPVAKCAPPLRDRGRQDALWASVLRGDIDCVTSDHSPCPTDDKIRGTEDIWAAWGGITGIQTLVPLTLTEGVHRRGLSLVRVAELIAGGAARIAGLWPRKGEILVGADADLMIVDLDRAWRVDAAWLESRHKHSPFIGRDIKGWIAGVLLRGETIVEDGGIAGAPRGRWLRRAG
jgi:allantoinase